MTTPRLSRQPDSVAAARAFLIAAATSDNDVLPTYQDVADSYGGIARAVAPVLMSLAADCAAAGEPDLTALVVEQATGRPATLQGVAFTGRPAQEATWANLLAQLRAYPWTTQAALPAPPRIGQEFPNRSAIAAVWGGDYQGGMATFARESSRIVNIFSDDTGPYPDRRVAGTDRIEYIGQGRYGDQKLTARGNALTEQARVDGEAARYWYRPTGGVFVFERWVAIVGRHREWHRDLNGDWRRAYVYDLAPVGSPNPADWPTEVTAEVDARSIDDDLDQDPPDPTLPAAPSLAELYVRMCKRAGQQAGKPAGKRSATDYARSAVARDAVLLRAQGTCENDQCAGMACDVRCDGTAILEVDHVKDLAKGGPDEPHNMIALCPNCHAAKTRGRARDALRRRLARLAALSHAELNGP